MACGLNIYIFVLYKDFGISSVFIPEDECYDRDAPCFV